MAFLSNLAAGISGAAPGLFSDLAVVTALLLCIAGLLSVPGVRRSGTARLMSVLDGLVAGGGMIAMASVLWPDLAVAGVIPKPFDPMTLAVDVSRLLGWAD